MEVFSRNNEEMDFKGFGGTLYGFRLFARFTKET
jgi:hypothetical protein